MLNQEIIPGSYVPRSTTSGTNEIFSCASSGVIVDLNSGVKTLFPLSGGTREGNASLHVEFRT